MYRLAPLPPSSFFTFFRYLSAKSLFKMPLSYLSPSERLPVAQGSSSFRAEFILKPLEIVEIVSRSANGTCEDPPDRALY